MSTIKENVESINGNVMVMSSFVFRKKRVFPLCYQKKCHSKQSQNKTLFSSWRKKSLLCRD